jgi:lipoate-protein ligase A
MMNRAGKTSNLSSGSVNRAPGARNPSSGSMNRVPGAGDWGSELRVVEYGRSGAHRNMAFDLHLFNLCEKGNQTGFLRLYGWSRHALSLGFFEPLGVVDTAKAIADGVEIVRRPTGGRAVLHGDDLTYTVVIPKSADHKVLGLYRTISESIISGMARLGVDLDLEPGTLGRSRLRNRPCFVSVSRYEIAHSGRKVVGSAQRVGRNAILQHGSIPLGGGYLNVVEYMNLPSRDRRQLRREIEASTCCVSELLGRRVTPEEVAAALVRGFVGGSEVPVARIAADRFDSEVVPLSVTLQEGFRPPQV